MGLRKNSAGEIPRIRAGVFPFKRRERDELLGHVGERARARPAYQQAFHYVPRDMACEASFTDGLLSVSTLYVNDSRLPALDSIGKRFWNSGVNVCCCRWCQKAYFEGVKSVGCPQWLSVSLGLSMPQSCRHNWGGQNAFFPLNTASCRDYT